MDNKYKKGAFIITIVLFIISLPFTIMGIIFHREQTGASNTNQEFHYKNKLYFYDTSKNLLGTYECKYTNCGYANETIDDGNYGINYFNLTMQTDKMIDNRFAILSDYDSSQSEIIIYDIKDKKELARYLEYKIYNVGLDNNYIIVKSISGYYGVIEIKNNEIQTVLPFEYNYIALPNKVKNSKIASDNFIVFKDNLWSIINKESKLTSDFVNIIVDYDDSNVIVKNQNEKYNLLSYTGISKLIGEYKSIKYLGNALEVRDSMNNYYILNKNTLIRLSNTYQVSDESIISTNVGNDGNINIIIDNETKETVEI